RTPSGRSIGHSRRATCWRPSKRAWRSILRSKALARPTSSSSWRSRAAMASKRRWPGAMRASQPERHDRPMNDACMRGALAQVLDNALGSLGHAVESTSGERKQPAELLALAGRVERALGEHGIAPNEPVHVRIANRPCDLGAFLGVWRAGAVAVPVHASAVPS